MNNPLISVICPIYNVESYFPLTLEEILKQTYDHLEIIIVDDGSTDKSFQICKSYEEKDCRIKVFHTENHGAAHARNYGLHKASGDYIVFIDSDDLIKPIYIEKLVDAALQSGEQIVICMYWNGMHHSPEEFANLINKQLPEIEVVDFEKYRFTNQYAHTVIWGGMYQSELVKNLEFDPDLYVGEDTFFFAEALSKTKSLAFIHDVFYYYTYRDSSLAHMKYHAKQMTEITAWEKLCDLFADESEDFQNECKAQLGWTCIKNYERAVLANYFDQSAIKGMYLKAKMYKKNIMKSKEYKITKKFFTTVFMLFPDFMVLLKRKCQSH